ncbi:MAG: FAD-binding oxidoreductase [Candidatus Bathyarchaeota archaeon]|nr:FAD-binding oxidoreductase [Candidatus Bathyarchaeota archaeon]
MKFEAPVQEIIIHNPDVISVRFAKPKDFTYKPGQYMLVTLNANGKSLMHPLTMSSSPTQNFLEFTKRLSTSEFSNTLRTLKEGDPILLDTPYGKFTFMGETTKITFLAGGIGITPFKSIIQYCTDTKQTANITLFYGVKTDKDCTFKEEFEQMQTRNPHLNLVLVASEAGNEWTGKRGYINADLIKTELPDYKEHMFYACGPPGMVAAMQKLVADMGLPPSQLKLEVLVGHN